MKSGREVKREKEREKESLKLRKKIQDLKGAYLMRMRGEVISLVMNFHGINF